MRAAPRSGDAGVDVLLEPGQLDEPERGAELRGLEVVSNRLEQELGVVVEAVDLDVEPVLDCLGFDEQGRAAAQERSSRALRACSSSLTHRIPPLPAQLMMCEP